MKRIHRWFLLCSFHPLVEPSDEPGPHIELVLNGPGRMGLEGIFVENGHFPEVVVKPSDTKQVAALVELAHQRKREVGPHVLEEGCHFQLAPVPARLTFDVFDDDIRAFQWLPQVAYKVAALRLIKEASDALGWYVGQRFDGTVGPLALGFAACAAGALAIVLATERGRLFRTGQ